MLQQKSFPLLHGQALERATDLFSPRNALLRMILRGIAEGDLVVHDRALAPSPARAGRATPIDQNPKQPRAEALGILAPREGAVGPHERILQCLLGILDAAQHVRR